MKKLIVLFLASLLLVACGTKEKEPDASALSSITKDVKDAAADAKATADKAAEDTKAAADKAAEDAKATADKPAKEAGK